MLHLYLSPETEIITMGTEGSILTLSEQMSAGKVNNDDSSSESAGDWWN